MRNNREDSRNQPTAIIIRPWLKQKGQLNPKWWFYQNMLLKTITKNKLSRFRLYICYKNLLKMIKDLNAEWKTKNVRRKNRKIDICELWLNDKFYATHKKENHNSELRFKISSLWKTMWTKTINHILEFRTANYISSQRLSSKMCLRLIYDQ